MAPSMLIAYRASSQAMWASRAGVFPHGPWRRTRARDLGGGRRRSVDEPETLKRVPTSHWDVCQEAATRHRVSEKSNPFFLPSSSLALKACYMWEKAQRKEWLNQIFLFKREKFQKTKWHCAFGQHMLLASHDLAVLKPRQAWENPKELVTLAYSRSWIKWPRGD